MHFVAAHPDQVLETVEDLKRALADPSFVCDVRRKVKSLWLCNLIREIEASGKYPYNNMVYRFAEDQLGLPPTHYQILCRKAPCFTALAFGASVAMGIHRRCKAQA